MSNISAKREIFPRDCAILGRNLKGGMDMDGLFSELDRTYNMIMEEFYS